MFKFLLINNILGKKCNNNGYIKMLAILSHPYLKAA